MRCSWQEAMEIATAAHVYTTKRYGPDRMFGFSEVHSGDVAGFVRRGVALL